MRGFDATDVTARAQVTSVVSDTQGKVERYYYELRKGLFDFDEVLAAQREDTHRRRDKA